MLKSFAPVQRTSSVLSNLTSASSIKGDLIGNNRNPTRSPDLSMTRVLTNSGAYKGDLALVHDQGYGGFARGSTPDLLQELHAAGIDDGRIVDLGCGSGIWAQELVDAGYQVVGVHFSPAMIELAPRWVPEADWRVGSFREYRIPPCWAVKALGEVFNDLFDAYDAAALPEVCRRAFDAFFLGGLLIFGHGQAGSQSRTHAGICGRRGLDLRG